MTPRYLITAATAGLITAAVTLPGPALAAPATPLPCSASMSNNRPADYTTTGVLVRTADRAKVVTVAHYKTTSHRKKGKAGATGRARIAYYISGATPGYKVKVTVTVARGGRSGSCSTSFTPHR